MISRRAVLTGLAGSAVFAPAFVQAQATGAGGRVLNAWRFSFPALKGGEIKLAAFANRPILISNTASFCGFASQLEGLEQLATRYGPRGLVVIGVPSGDFGGQEAETSEEIARHAEQGHGTRFPLTTKQHVKGDEAHPFFKWAAAQKPNDLPRWNFHKYLIGRDGQIAAVFGTMTSPNDTKVIAAIAKELG